MAPVGGETEVDWPDLWNKSEEAREMEREIERISLKESGRETVIGEEQVSAPAFAASYWVQVKELTIRNVRVSSSTCPCRSGR